MHKFGDADGRATHVIVAAISQEAAHARCQHARAKQTRPLWLESGATKGGYRSMKEREKMHLQTENFLNDMLICDEGLICFLSYFVNSVKAN